MVNFYASWDMRRGNTAGWSGELERETLGDAGVQKLVAKVVPVKLDVEKDGKELGKKYRITKYPTVLFLDKNGVEMGRIDGFEPPEEFTKHTDTFLKDFAKEPGLRSKYKSNPKDLDTVAALGVIEANRYKTEPALQKLKEAEALDRGNKTGKITDLYSAVGDIYQNASQYEPAIGYFKKAANTSKVTDKKAYALLSIATCYMSMQGPFDPKAEQDMAKRRQKILANYKLALPYIEETLKLPNLGAEDKEIALSNQRAIREALADD